MPIVVVEREYEEPVTAEFLRKATETGAWCYELHNIRYLHSIVAADGKRVMCLYDAPDLESVRTAQQTTGMTYERLWAASFFFVDESRDPRKL